MSSGEIVVRPATADDADAAATVHARSWQTAYAGLVPNEVIERVVGWRGRRAEAMRELFAAEGIARRSWVVVVDGEVVGVAIWAPSEDPDADGSTAAVELIYLHPDHVGRGVGRRLWQAVVDDIGAAGFAVATLWVLEANARARRFYEAAGWRPDGAAKDEDFAGGVLHEVRYRGSIAGSRAKSEPLR